MSFDFAHGISGEVIDALQLTQEAVSSLYTSVTQTTLSSYRDTARDVADAAALALGRMHDVSDCLSTILYRELPQFISYFFIRLISCGWKSCCRIVSLFFHNVCKIKKSAELHIMQYVSSNPYLVHQAARLHILDSRTIVLSAFSLRQITRQAQQYVRRNQQ
jgi:hypothetical protein